MYYSIDGVVRRIDINALVERIDINALIDRIDVQRVVDRIDVESLVLRSNVSAIITQSTTGVFTQLLDSIRVQVVMLDLYLLRASRGFACLSRRGQGVLPQKPNGSYEENHQRVPSRRMDKAVAVQGRYTGIFAKGTAAVIDLTLVTISFGILLVLAELVRIFFSNNEDLGKESLQKASTKAKSYQTENWHSAVALVVYCIYWFLYFFTGPALTGQTIGMAIVGIKIVNADSGVNVTPCRALFRTALLPLTMHILPILCLVGGLRRDGRMIHDLAANTGLVYKWNARLASMRDRALRRMERESFMQAEVSTAATTSSSADDDEPLSSMMQHNNAPSSEHSPLLSSRTKQ